MLMGGGAFGSAPILGTPEHAIYGDGSDGDLTLTGNISLTRDTYYNNLDVSTFSLRTNGWRLFVKGLLTVDVGGAVHHDGDPGGAGTGGLGAVTNALGGGANGADDNGNGDDITEHGQGGNGGDGGGNAASGGTVTQMVAALGRIRNIVQGMMGRGMNLAPTSLARALGGAGGGGGDAGGGEVGGGGGGGGGVCMVAANNVINDGRISANGGDGGDATVGDAGGGGGGGGGVMFLFSSGYSGSGTVSASGGAGGAGLGAGVDGSPGVDGILVLP